MTYSIEQFFLLGFLTLVFVGLITPPIRNIALRVGAVDAPTLARKAQKEPVPYLGGVAIAIGIVSASYGSILAVDFSVDSLKLASFVLVPAIAISAMDFGMTSKVLNRGLVSLLKHLPESSLLSFSPLPTPWALPSITTY